MTSKIPSGLLLVLVLLWPNVGRAQYTLLNLPDGYVQVQGDVITTRERAAELLAQLDGHSTNGVGPRFVYAPTRLWPRVVPYDFDSSVSAGQQGVFLAAMAAWSNSFPGVTTISFQPRNNEAAYIHFAVGDPGGFCGGVTDYIGYNGGKVSITISNCALNVFLIAHEVGHALGLWHEQARGDRNGFITIVTNNIQSGALSQFAIASPQSTFGSYDYDSVMHYFACSFSTCSNCSCANAGCVGMAASYPAQQCNMGQRTHLSAMDKRSMAFMYGPPNWKFLYPLPGSLGDGSFQQPYVSVPQAAADVPSGSTLWLGPGTYAAAGMTIKTPMTLSAAIPDLQLQPDGSLGPSPSGYATLR